MKGRGESMAVERADHGFDIIQFIDIKEEKKLAKRELKDWKKQMKETEKFIKKEIKSMRKNGIQKVVQHTDALAMISSMSDKEIDTLVNSTRESKLQDFMKEFQKYIPVSGTSPVDKLKVMLKFAFKSLALKESSPVDISAVHDNKDQVLDGKVVVAENAIAIKKEVGAVKYIDQDVTIKNEISILQQHIKTMIPSYVHDRLKIRATFLKKKLHKFKSERDTMMLEKHRLAEEVSDLKYDILLEKEVKADAELASLQETKKYEKYRKLFHQLQSKYDTFSNNAIVEQRRLLFEFGYKLQNGSCNHHQLELKEMQEKMIQLEIKLKDEELKENGLDLLKEKEKHIQEMMIDLKAQQKNILDEHARCKDQDEVRFVQQEMRMKELFRHKREEYYALKEKLDIKEDQAEIEELEVKIEMLTTRLREKDEKIKSLIASNEKLAQQLHACGEKSKSTGKQKKHRKGLSKDDCILCTNHDKIKASEKKEDKGNTKIKQFFGVNKKAKTPKQENKITISHVGFHCQFCCAENKNKVQAEPKKEKKELRSCLRKRTSIQQQMVRNPDFETAKNSVNGASTPKNQQMFLIKEIERAVRFLTEDYNKNNPEIDGKDSSVQGRLLASLIANVGRIKDGMLFEFPAQEILTNTHEVLVNEQNNVGTQNSPLTTHDQQNEEKHLDEPSGKEENVVTCDELNVSREEVERRNRENKEVKKSEGDFNIDNKPDDENESITVPDSTPVVEPNDKIVNDTDMKQNSSHSDIANPNATDLSSGSEESGAEVVKRSSSEDDSLASHSDDSMKPVIGKKKKKKRKKLGGKKDVKTEGKIKNDESKSDEESAAKLIQKYIVIKDGKMHYIDSSSDEELSAYRSKQNAEKRAVDQSDVDSSLPQSTSKGQDIANCVVEKEPTAVECSKTEKENTKPSVKEVPETSVELVLETAVVGKKKATINRKKKKRPIWMTWKTSSDEESDKSEVENVEEELVKEKVKPKNFMDEIRKKKQNKDNNNDGEQQLEHKEIVREKNFMDVIREKKQNMKKTGEIVEKKQQQQQQQQREDAKGKNSMDKINEKELNKAKKGGKDEKKNQQLENKGGIERKKKNSDDKIKPSGTGQGSSTTKPDYDIDLDLENVTYVPTIFEGTNFKLPGHTSKTVKRISFSDMIAELQPKLPAKKVIKKPASPPPVRKSAAEIQKSLDELFTTDLHREAALRSERRSRQKQLSPEETEFLTYIPKKLTKENKDDDELVDDLFKDELAFVKRRPKSGRRYQA